MIITGRASRHLLAKRTIATNVPCLYQDHVNGHSIPYDHQVDKYNNSVSAFLYRRWTQKEEVPPQIHVTTHSSPL